MFQWVSSYQPTDKLISFRVIITSQSYNQRAKDVFYQVAFVCELPLSYFTLKVPKIYLALLCLLFRAAALHASCIKALHSGIRAHGSAQ